MSIPHSPWLLTLFVFFLAVLAGAGFRVGSTLAAAMLHRVGLHECVAGMAGVAL